MPADCQDHQITATGASYRYLPTWPQCHGSQRRRAGVSARVAPQIARRTAWTTHDRGDEAKESPCLLKVTVKLK
jgi:hypothetical protein